MFLLKKEYRNTESTLLFFLKTFVYKKNIFCHSTDKLFINKERVHSANICWSLTTFEFVKFEKDILYIWVGGSCDYGHKERAGGGAYIAEIFESPHGSSNNSRSSSHAQSGKIIDTYTTADFNAKEFQMIFRVMDHALEKFGNNIGTGAVPIVFLSNVQYIQNYPKPENVEIKILPYHKFPRQKEVHDMASDAMRKLRGG